VQWRSRDEVSEAIQAGAGGGGAPAWQEVEEEIHVRSRGEEEVEEVLSRAVVARSRGGGRAHAPMVMPASPAVE
jgi:hypothetical protein